MVEEDLPPEDPVTRFLEVIDDRSRALLWFVWLRCHADVRAIRDGCGFSTDMEILRRIKEVINPGAMARLGRPVLEFFPCRIDPWTGEKVAFSWWFNPEVCLPHRRRRLVDVFEEDGRLTVLVEWGGPFSPSPEVVWHNGFAVIRLAGDAGHAGQGVSGHDAAYQRG